MSFEKMFPNASGTLLDISNRYKAIKQLIKTSSDFSGVNKGIDYLLDLIEKLHDGAADDWEEIQEHYSEKSNVVEGLKGWADWLGLKGSHSYLPAAKTTFENLKKEFSKIEKNKEKIRKQYKKPEDYRDKVLKPLCESAKSTFQEYEQHKDREMESYSKKHPDIKFDESNIYAFWALLKMIHSSANNDLSKSGKHYDKAFGGGFLGFVFTRITDFVFSIYGLYRDPSNQPIKKDFGRSVLSGAIDDYAPEGKA